MSMLQQILDQMFVDPEILDALDEEQKQILFIKMREEQVKRWKAFEEKCEKEGEPQIRKSRDGSRRIRWLKGEDGEVWVWVMGEHKDDLTIEQITEKRAFEEARQLAEKEMLESMRLTELNDDYVPVVGPHEDENTLKEQLSRMEPWNSANANNRIQESMYEDANSLFDPTFNGNVQWPLHALSSQEVMRKGILKHTNEHFPPDSSDSLGDGVSSDTNVAQLTAERAHGTDFCNGLVKNNSADDRSQVLPSTSMHSTSSGEIALTNTGSVDNFDKKISADVAGAHYGTYNNYLSAPSELRIGSGVRSSRSLGTEDMQWDRSVPYEQRRIGAPLKENSGMPAQSVSWMSGNYPTYPGLRKNVPIISSQDMNASDYGSVKFRSDPRARHDLSGIDEEISKRQSEIFEKIKEKHQQFDREAEQEAKRAEQAWEEQERKARGAEAQIRRIAQRAREQHRQQSLRTSSSILPVLKDANASSLREALKSLPRPPKPKSREAIISWFKVEELQRGTGLDPLLHRPAVWFHGIISRSRADELLQNKPSGSFLVRVSERIWGYTLSYVVGDGNVKHFLIERIPQGYQFLGTNQVVHKHLHELVAFHEVSPITLKGNEILRWAVGQEDVLPDYADLIPV